MPRRKSAWRSVLWIFAALLESAACAQQADLGAVDARSLMQQACVQCHDFRIILSQRKTAAAWRRTINEMIWKGAPLMPGEAAVLTDYLARSFGPSAVSGSGAKKQSRK